jgi:hypothetical protein
MAGRRCRRHKIAELLSFPWLVAAQRNPTTRPVDETPGRDTDGTTFDP